MKKGLFDPKKGKLIARSKKRIKLQGFTFIGKNKGVKFNSKKQ